jgi:hypothetical protein
MKVAAPTEVNTAVIVAEEQRRRIELGQDLRTIGDALHAVSRMHREAGAIAKALSTDAAKLAVARAAMALAVGTGSDALEVHAELNPDAPIGDPLRYAEAGAKASTDVVEETERRTAETDADEARGAASAEASAVLFTETRQTLREQAAAERQQRLRVEK